MRRILTVSILILAASWLAGAAGWAAPPDSAYGWLEQVPARRIADAFAPPAGFDRSAAPAGSYGDWLRHLPLAPPGTPVRNHDGREKGNQASAAAVIEIDVGRRDLQQCADAVMRLRAEYLRAAGRAADLSFKFTSGHAFPYSRWLAGKRPRVRGNDVGWTQGAARADGRGQFRAWLDVIFTYAGTWSMVRDSAPVASVSGLRIGDVLIQGAFPGHALLVVDLARNPAGETAVLLAQSYMPAQSIHVVVNPADPTGGAWYRLDDRRPIPTPDWPRPFSPKDFRRLPDTAPAS
ncbi:MAG: DUF4846 domain-containing protein [Kiloniellales bacterium]|nr:DUF4846 domain-containing protein [Kiloniellales bacterium]